MGPRSLIQQFVIPQAAAWLSYRSYRGQNIDGSQTTYLLLSDALASLTAADVRQLDSHHKKFYIWMKAHVSLAGSNDLAPDSSEWANHGIEEKVKLIEEAIAASVNRKMVCRLGPQILSVLRREMTPLELMLEDKLLHRYYLEALKWN